MLCKHVREGGCEAVLWVCGTLSRQHHVPSMLLYDLNGGDDNNNNNKEEEDGYKNNNNNSYGEVEEPSFMEGLRPIIDTLIGYAQAAKDAELKGPSGLRDGVAKDALQSVGLIPNDYKLVHYNGRIDEQSISNTMSTLQ